MSATRVIFSAQWQRIPAVTAEAFRLVRPKLHWIAWFLTGAALLAMSTVLASLLLTKRAEAGVEDWALTHSDTLATVRRDEAMPARPLPAANLDLLAVVRMEKLALEPFDLQGVPRIESFDQIDHLFRSAKGSEVPIDPRLVELLMQIQRRFDGRQLVLISGHRDPGWGTSNKSFHVRGMAADIAVAGVSPSEVRSAALELGARGVGLYPSFVHVDVRDVPYKWIAGRGRR